MNRKQLRAVSGKQEEERGVLILDSSRKHKVQGISHLLSYHKNQALETLTFTARAHRKVMKEDKNMSQEDENKELGNWLYLLFAPAERIHSE